MANAEVVNGNGNGREQPGTFVPESTRKRERPGTSPYREVPVVPERGSSSHLWVEGNKSELIAAALAPLDRVARQTESCWGVGRLETLIPPELAAKVAMAREQLDEAIAANDAAAVATYAAAMMRAWAAMDQAARTAGHSPEDVGRVWFVEAADRRFAIVQDATDIGPIQDKHPDVSVWAVAEVARVLASRDLTTVLAAKKAFPGAVVTNVSRPIDWARGDDVSDIGLAGNGG